MEQTKFAPKRQKRRGDRNKDNLVPLPALPPNTCT